MTTPITQGHVKAATWLGEIQLFGLGTPVDYSQAFASYTIGAEGGDCTAQYVGGVNPTHDQW